MERSEYDAMQNDASNLNTLDSDLRNKKIDEMIAQLSEANKRLRFLEERVQNLSGRLPKPYPVVKHRNYRNKRRILVSIHHQHGHFNEFIPFT